MIPLLYLPKVQKWLGYLWLRFIKDFWLRFIKTTLILQNYLRVSEF